MTERELLRVVIRTAQDVFVVRQVGREAAVALGLEHQDQIRLATALSELGRQLLTAAGGAVVTFRVPAGDPPWLGIELVAALPVAAVPQELHDAVVAAGRLVTTEYETREAVPRLVITRRLPRLAAGIGEERMEQLRAQLGELVPTDALTELAVQNQHLLTTLAEVERQRDELLRLNAELEETNQGVMALYRQLSEELEETNRGVVALYAELDKRSAQLRRANEAKSRFLANISHELRAPVATVIGLSRLLLDGGAEPLTADQAEQVGLIRSSAADLLLLVNDLLDLAKAESGRLEPTLAEVLLDRVFDQLRATLRPLATGTEVTLVVEDPTGVPALVTDPTLLTQVLRNLLTNGLKFTGSGEVRLTAVWLEAEATVRLEVSDTGVGIAEDQVERVFEEFYQVPGTRTSGTGLGLPYSRRVVEVLGGTLSLRSTPGEGSVFTVELPQLPPEQPGGSPPSAAAVSRATQ
jgi:signal transduction histidine kinase